MLPKFKYKNLHVLQDAISSHTNKLWIPSNLPFFTDDPTDSWYDKHYFSRENEFNEIKTNATIPKIKGKLYKSKTVLLKLDNPDQKVILLNWLNAFRIMYNYTISHIFYNLRKKDIILLKSLIDQNYNSYKIIQSKKKENKVLITSNKKIHISIRKLSSKKKNPNAENSRIVKLKELINQLIINKNTIKQNNIAINDNNKTHCLTNQTIKTIRTKIDKTLNYQNTRTYILKDIRNSIMKKSGDILKEKFKNSSVYTHILDSAIKKASANYKTCVINYLEGNCKTFKIKYWRKNKKSLMMEIESCYIKNNQIAESILGKMRYIYDKNDYILPNTTINLYYNRESNQFTVGIPEKVNLVKSNNTKTVSIDQGMKTYLSCITDDEAIKYGTNMIERLMPKIDRILKAKSFSFLSKERKRGIEKKYMTKIKNMVDDAQWKIINDLTDNYKTIIIGNLSSKEVTNKARSGMTANMKELAYKLRFYEFRQRLKYKCTAKGINYKVVNEAYTSKVCSCCGNYKKDLKNDRIYKCDKCKLIMDRDLNGARNILMKTIIE